MRKETILFCAVLLMGGVLRAEPMKKAISKLVTTGEGKTYLEVDGD